jgi:4'-phosphopantetheinyl transferase
VKNCNIFEIFVIDNNSEVISKNILCLINSDFDDLFANKELFLHQQELALFNTIVHKKRQYSYLHGRYCAKLAITNLVADLQLSEIYLAQGVFGFPYIAQPNYLNLQVSISHSLNDAAAILFSQFNPMAIDIEQIYNNRHLAIQSQLKKRELYLIKRRLLSNPQGLIILWTAKEALAKTLKCGMTIDFKLLEIQSVILQADGKYMVTFTKFSQYKALVWQVRTFMCALIIPKNINISINKIA